MIIRVPALGPSPSPVTDTGLRGVRLGQLLWRPFLNSALSVVPPLAKTVSGRADGSSIEAVIDTTAAWSDGEPVLARDVVAAAHRVDTVGLDILELADRRVRFIGDGAVRFVGSFTPARVTDGRTDLTITSGPYRLASLDRSRAALRHTVSNGMAPDTVEFIAMEDLDDALTELRHGRLDVILEADEAVVTEVINSPGPAVIMLPDAACLVQVLGFRAHHPTLTPAVCARLAQLIDRNAIASRIYRGLAHAGSWSLTAATGTMGTAQGEVALLVNAENRLRRATAECIVADWIRSGVTARIDVAPWATFTKRLHDGAFDCFLVSVRDTKETSGVLSRLTRSRSADELTATEISIHASWAALAPKALRHVPLLVAVTGGGIAC